MKRRFASMGHMANGFGEVELRWNDKMHAGRRAADDAREGANAGASLGVTRWRACGGWSAFSGALMGIDAAAGATLDDLREAVTTLEDTEPDRARAFSAARARSESD